MPRGALPGGSLTRRIRIERRALAGETQDGLTWGDGEAVEDGAGDEVAWSPPVEGDGAGNIMGEWFTLAEVRADIRELRGDESVLADKLTGTGLVLIVLRANRVTKTVSTNDRIIDLGYSERVLNIRRVLLEARSLYLTLICEAGVAV